MPAMFAVRQGEHLSFIHSYTTTVGVSPSFEDIGMIKTLERCGLLSRSPGVARSLRARSPSAADAAVAAALAVLAEGARWVRDGARHRRSAARR